jgi:hypothetical protein
MDNIMDNGQRNAKRRGKSVHLKNVLFLFEDIAMMRDARSLDITVRGSGIHRETDRQRERERDPTILWAAGRTMQKGFCCVCADTDYDTPPSHLERNTGNTFQ